ncbi:recombination protein RecR [Candidatus Kaiserbacteria bacterium]|nr:recombination protein RecR [Candidatus Kaiserbacteria bacterium]
MDPLDKLTALFEKFPGIGPRQAQRFVQFLLRSSAATRKDLSEAVRELSSAVHQCPSCMRYHSGDKGECSLCTNADRDASLLAVVATDADIAALERSGTYKGRYFVMGGTISLASEKKNGLRERQLLESIVTRVKKGLREVILSFPASPEGDFTALHVRDSLEPYAKEHGFKITTLGRGLSTGSELEYADPDTLKSALENRR